MGKPEFIAAQHRAELEARRFIESCEDWRIEMKARDEGCEYFPEATHTGPHRAAMIRASLDLTKALARLRSS